MRRGQGHDAIGQFIQGIHPVAAFAFEAEPFGGDQINRNKIFSSLREEDKPELKKAFSEDCYYSPLTSTLPLAPYTPVESIPTEK